MPQWVKSGTDGVARTSTVLESEEPAADACTTVVPAAMPTTFAWALPDPSVCADAGEMVATAELLEVKSTRAPGTGEPLCVTVATTTSDAATAMETDGGARSVSGVDGAAPTATNAFNNPAPQRASYCVF